MALTNIEIVRLRTGDRVEPYFVSNDEIDEFLEMNSDNVGKTVIDVSYAILFYLAANPSIYRERTGEEEVFTTDPYKAYKDALLLGIKYPHRFLNGIMPYAAGISKADRAIYKSDPDSELIGAGLPNNANDVGHFIEENSIYPHIGIPILGL